MVRIAGIDRDVSEVELMLTNMTIEESIQETMSWLANIHSRIGDNFEGTLELDSGKKVTIRVEERKE